MLKQLIKITYLKLIGFRYEIRIYLSLRKYDSGELEQVGA